jgi:hypothetical protein
VGTRLGKKKRVGEHQGAIGEFKQKMEWQAGLQRVLATVSEWWRSRRAVVMGTHPMADSDEDKWHKLVKEVRE